MIPKLTWFLLLFLSMPLALAGHNLTQEFALKRKKQITALAYKVNLNFTDSNAYEGDVGIDLSLSQLNEPLVFDSGVQKIKTISINQKLIKDFTNSNGIIEIPARHLVEKMNIEIHFSTTMQEPSMMWFTDPVDGKKYFYTNLEPFGLNDVFPCFDQPDLKATFQLNVQGPRDWTIIGNEEPRLTKIIGNAQKVEFPKTLPISPYLFFVGGGHYEVFSDEYKKLPLKIYVRSSLKKYVDAKNLFDLTKRGLAFYESYFDYPYPFSKYAHVFVPNFSSSGMENPGAVTMNERFIYPDQVPRSYHEKRENLIYHEMAHIWFGDLVTMEWWDDLWLNESFATFMAYLGQERIFKDKGRWLQFESTKIWARMNDEKSSTHPILGPTPDVIAAESGFDGITYGKGAASLKQLFFYAGEESFKKGIQSYFKKYAFKNTKLRDFINTIDKHSAKDLEGWGNRWFKTKGLNSISVDFSCQDNKIQHFEVLQIPTLKGNLTPHKSVFGLYQDSGKKFRLLDDVVLEYSVARTTFPQLVGKICPDFIMPNKDNHDYGLFTLDRKSLKLRKKAIAVLPDNISRLQLWVGLKQDVDSGKINAMEFFDIAMHALKSEKDGTLLSVILGIQNSILHLIKDPLHHYLTPSERKIVAPKLESILFNRLINAEHFSDLKSMIFELYVLTARTPLSQERLFRFLQKGDNIRGIKLGQEVRWNIIMNLAYNNHPKTEELIKHEMKRDPSYQGEIMALSAKASIPSMTLKKDLWPKMLSPWELSYSVVQQGAMFIHHPDYPELSKQFLKSYFTTLENTDWDLHKGFIWYYLNMLFPQRVCSEEVVKMSKASMKKAKLNSYAQRIWQESQENLERCVRIRKGKDSLVVR